MTKSKTKNVKAAKNDIIVEKITGGKNLRRIKGGKKPRANKGGKISVLRESVPINQSTAPSIGESIGSKVGGFLQGAASSLFGKLFGMGAYTVNKNALLDGQDPPAFENKLGSTRVMHREYIQDIVGSELFNNFLQIPLNPANPQLPFLSQIAQNYDEYKIHGMVFEYKPTSGTAVSGDNPALGTIVMATQYDSYNPLFPDKRHMENYEFCTSAVPSQSCMHPVECEASQTSNPHKYTRNTYGPVQGDIRNYDLGRFEMATFGMPGNNNIVGELWCSYIVDLYKPKIPDNISNNLAFTLDLGQGVYVPGGTGNLSGTNYFGTSSAIYSALQPMKGSNLNPTWVDQNTINFGQLPAGNYTVCMSFLFDQVISSCTQNLPQLPYNGMSGGFIPGLATWYYTSVGNQTNQVGSSAGTNELVYNYNLIVPANNNQNCILSLVEGSAILPPNHFLGATFSIWSTPVNNLGLANSPSF